MPMYFCILIDIFPYIQYVQHLVQNENEIRLYHLY